MKKYKNRSRRIARELYWEKHDKDSYECPDCGRTEDEIVGGFEVHHKNGEPMDNRPENQIGLCPLCHNLREGKKPSIEQIKNLRSSSKPQGEKSTSGKPSVYLAGSMDYETSETQHWRNCLGSRYEKGRYKLPDEIPIKVNSPTEVMFCHGQGNVVGIANDDMKLVEKSDAILAYFDKSEQVGTLTELVYAVSIGKPALVIFKENLINCPGPFDIENRVEYSFCSQTYWFLINFLHASGDWEGHNSDVKVATVSDKEELSSEFVNWGWFQKQRGALS